MNFKVYSVYDSKAKAFLPPFYLPMEGMAVRTFSDCINSDSHQFGAHPEDYGLFTLGEFDDQSGIMDTIIPEIVRTGLSLVQESPKEEDQLDMLEESSAGQYERARVKQVKEMNS